MKSKYIEYAKICHYSHASKSVCGAPNETTISENDWRMKTTNNTLSHRYVTCHQCLKWLEAKKISELEFIRAKIEKIEGELFHD